MTRRSVCCIRVSLCVNFHLNRGTPTSCWGFNWNSNQLQLKPLSILYFNSTQIYFTSTAAGFKGTQKFMGGFCSCLFLFKVSKLFIWYLLVHVFCTTLDVLDAPGIYRMILKCVIYIQWQTSDNIQITLALFLDIALDLPDKAMKIYLYVYKKIWKSFLFF